jgi:hypothetical protein
MTGDNAEKDASSKLFPPADRARVEVAVTEQNVPLGGRKHFKHAVGIMHGLLPLCRPLYPVCSCVAGMAS